MPRPEPRPANPLPLVRDPGERSFPLSAGQERLWWLRQLDSSNSQYHITGGWWFANGLEPAALASAFAALVRRHEILRTRFVLRSDGSPGQEVIEPVEVPLTWAGPDWRPVVEKAATAPFDLTSPPLLRAVVAELDGGHGLFVALHHIVTDRWSMDVLPRDLIEFYRAAAAGREPRLPELPVQYGDYSAWQRGFLTGERLRPHLEHWKRALAGYQRLDLPADRPAGTGASGATVVAELSEETTAALTATAWRARASPFMVITAALAEVLGTAARQRDIVLGAIVSDRPRPELRELIGFFVNTVVLRVDAGGAALTFRELIVRTRDAWLAADAHQDAPFEQIVGELNAGTDDGANPIFDVVVNHAGDRDELAGAPGAPVWWRPELPETARFDLSLTTQITGGRLRASFLYRPAVFDEAPIAALAARYVRLLDRGLAEPDRPLRELDLVDELELKQLHARNDQSPAPEATVVELVEAQAVARPDAAAVTGAEGVLSYRELNERANRLSCRLRELGAGPETVVAVCLAPTVHRFVVLLGVAKTGAAYFPVDRDFPAERLEFLLADSGALFTVADAGLERRVPGRVLVFDELDLDGYDDRDPPAAATAGNLAYLISTSGSTGEPKSVAIAHRALSRLVAGAPAYLDIGPGSVFLQTAPLTFDVAVLEWAPLAHGGTVVHADTGTLLEHLGEVVREHRVSTLKLVSPQLDLVVEAGLTPFTGVRQLVVGGDVVNPKSFRAVTDALPGCRVTASYGPTESTVLATVHQEGSPAGRVPIGQPIPYTSVYLLDRHLNPVPVGMRGEIYLAGDGLARGYHGKPGLTAAAFLPDPFGPPGSRMYRTGDLGRRLPGGAVDHLGRADGQVKIRGYRIETSEIEHALLRLPEVGSAVVVRTDTGTGPCLAAYVTATAPVDSAAARAHLRATLPAYMVPEHLVEVPRFTLTANGKIDRTALPPVTTSVEEVTAVSALDARVAEAWSGVLGRPMPPGGDFFAHGGHSLLVPRATAAVRRLLGQEVPLRLMLEHRTPVSYAAAVLRERGTDHGAATRQHRLERHTWAGPDGERRLDLFVSTENPDTPRTTPIRTLVVLDGAEFTDIMRLPATLDRLVAGGHIPTTAAVFLSPRDWAARRRELLDDALPGLLADEVLPRLHDWLGDRPADRAIALGASLGAVTAIRTALHHPERIGGAVALSGPLTEHQLLGSGREAPSRFFLSASREEHEIELDDGHSLLAANVRTAAELTARGHTVEFAQGEGGHTYAAWESMLPRALTWILGNA